MRIENDNQLVDSIPTPLTRENKNRIFLWLTKKDIIVATTILIIFALVWIPLLFTKNIVPAISILLFSIFIIVILTLPFGGETLYWYLWKWMNFKSQKSIQTHKSERINDLIVRFNSDNKKEYVSFYKVTGVNTDLLDNILLMGMYNNLSNLFVSQTEKKHFELIKISSNNEYEKIKSNFENKTISSFVKTNNDFIENLNGSDFKKVNKLIIAIYTSKEMDNFLYKNEIENILKMSKLVLSELTPTEVDEIRNDIWLDNSLLIQRKNKLKIINLVTKEHKFCSILAINKLPNIVGPEWINSISEFKDMNFILKSSVYEAKKSKSILDKAILNAKYETERNKISAQQMEIDQLNYEILSETATKVAQDSSLFVSCKFYLIVSDTSEIELNKKINTLKTKFKYIDCELNTFNFNQLDAFISMAETNSKIDKEIGYDILSNTLGFGFPYKNINYFDKNSFVLGLDEENQAIGIDWSKNLSKNENSNLILQGISGSGKTTTAKQIILSQIASNDFNVYVIDPENEYSQLINDVGGTVIDLSNPDYFINPFHYIKFEGNNVDSQLLNNEIFFKFLFEDAWNTETKTILLNACKELYQKHKNEFTFSNLYDHLVKNYRKHETLIEVIKLYTKKGVYGDIWDKKTNIKLENNSIAFNFQEVTNSYGSSFKEAKIFLLLKFLESKVIENRLSKSNKYVSIFIDEGHLFTSPKMIDTLTFIFNWFKRIRKYSGMIAFLTQNINDLLGNKELLHLTSAIFNNTNYLMFLKFSPNEVRQLDSLLNDLGGLSDYEKEYLITANRGQGILFLENIRTRIQVIKNI